MWQGIVTFETFNWIKQVVIPFTGYSYDTNTYTDKLKIYLVLKTGVIIEKQIMLIEKF